ncbi:MAG: 30S ribosomal protein S8 [Candidatus Taylorbacteria bacterium]|nr:30S ribosomal protein S8 [Candidatus Taylorbacteria bacterium]
MSPISNMLVQIKNAQAVGKEQVLFPFSNMNFKIAGILKDNGFVQDVERRKKKEKKSEQEYLSVTLKYDEDGQPAISGFKVISRPSRHLYTGVKDIKSVRSGYGIAVISTSKGVMSSKEARKQNLGGEMLFEVW